MLKLELLLNGSHYLSICWILIGRYFRATVGVVEGKVVNIRAFAPLQKMFENAFLLVGNSLVRCLKGKIVNFY